MRYIVTWHAIENLRERFPELSTGDKWVDEETIQWLATDALQFGAQQGNDKLLLCSHKLQPVLATKPDRDDASKEAIVTVLTYDQAMANSQVKITRETERKHVPVTDSPAKH